MKNIIVPLVIALLTGLGGASGFSYVSAKKMATVIAAHRADSVKAHVKDSTEAKEKAENEEKTKASAVPEIDSATMTPADSIRLAKHLPTTSTTTASTSLRESTRGLANALDMKHAAAVAKPDGKSEPKVAGKSAMVAVAKPGATDASRGVADEGALPQPRIAKIFATMQSKDAVKVLEQMNDADVRTILAMMSDKQAASILSLFTPARAAAITKGEMAKSDKKTPGAKP